MSKILGGFIELPNVKKMVIHFFKTYYKYAKIYTFGAIWNILTLAVIIYWTIDAKEELVQNGDTALLGICGILFVYMIKAIFTQGSLYEHIEELEEELENDVAKLND